jgi:Uncharacterized protein conserved in bacteria (DUF2330)
MKKVLIVSVVLLSLTISAHADKGPIVWHEGVEVSQESQKAIILHNAAEEVLILGTEMKANKKIEMLEFIPFPSEPTVSLATGAPFEEIAKLIKKKGLVFQFSSIGKGPGTTESAPVEIRLSEKIGLHDVTAIKINDIGQFSTWLEDFFKSNGIQADKEKLSNVYGSAQDYVRRGINYFVFDRVEVSENIKFIEPLMYRFRTDKIYYPLKTSNLIGGRGAVELILVLPGSISDDIWQTVRKVFVRGDGVEIMMSSSSKLRPKEVESIYASEPFFGKTAKTYLQVFKYSGPYNFADDFSYAVGALVPYAYRYVKEGPIAEMTQVVPPFAKDEVRDLREAFCLESNPRNVFSVRRYGLDCWDYIPNDEYEAYAALFKKGSLAGIPWGRVVLENKTIRATYKGKKVDKTILKDYHDKNRVGYPVEDAFPDYDEVSISPRGDTEAAVPSSKGRTSVSRAGFNQDRSKALVYVNHIAGPRSGVSYFVTLEKKSGEWQVAGFEAAKIEARD